jgi:proline iminopeptidase
MNPEHTEPERTRSGTAHLFPPIEPYGSGRLAVGAGHSLYWEQSGNPDGAPVVFLHGGPGAGATAEHRRFFDPRRYRIVVFDQRGAGRSTPLGALEDNTTAHLVADIERLRNHLGIGRWQVFGGSWGSTLGLAYAQAHPERVTALVLRGIFLGSRREIDWFLDGMGRFQPAAHQAFLAALPGAERTDPLGHYHRRLVDPDPAVHRPAAHAWSTYEGACSTLRPSPETVAAFGRDEMALSLARLEAHYFVNGCFLENGQLLAGMERIRRIPAVLVQGRYDLICPPETACALADAWPEAELVMVPDAGHAAMEPGIAQALVAATERFKEIG